MLTDAEILDRLSIHGPFYLEIDEPNGIVRYEPGTHEFVVQRRGKDRAYPEIHRCATLREALDAALTLHFDGKEIAP